MGTTLIVRGALRGMGRDVECTLIVTRNEELKAPHAVYTRCTVLEAPAWLPDGYYEVTFNGQSAFLHRLHGLWSVGVPWRHIETQSLARVA